MRVLHVTPSLSDLRGGPSRAVLEIVKALCRQGVDAEIATTNDDGNDLLDVPLGQRVDWKGAPTYFFARFSPPVGPLREFTCSWPFTRWLRQSMRSYDLVHVHALFSYTSTLAMTLARQQTLPYICTPHGLLCEWSMGQGTAKKQFYLALVEKANLNAAAALHYTDVTEERQCALLHLCMPGVVVPLGIEQPVIASDAHRRLRTRLGLAHDEPLILFMGRLHPKKGLEFLISALGRLTAERFTFILAGSGDSDYVRELEKLLSTNNIAHRTYRPGFVTGEDKSLLLQGADLFALTSHSENFGIAVLEALAVGVPVLLTPGVPLSALVEERRLGYVSKLDVEAIAATLQRFLREPQEAQLSGQRAKSFVLQNYTWEHTAARLERVYESVLNRGSV